MNARIFLLLMLVAVFTGCSSVQRTSTGEPIYFVGTPQYQRKVETLPLTIVQARDRVVAYLADTRPSPTNPRLDYLIGKHQVIVGDCFVFAMPDKVNIILSGYYVDGRTGAVTERQEGRTSYPKKL